MENLRLYIFSLVISFKISHKLKQRDHLNFFYYLIQKKKKIKMKIINSIKFPELDENIGKKSIFQIVNLSINKIFKKN